MTTAPVLLTLAVLTAAEPAPKSVSGAHLVPAFDPAILIRPPLARYPDGSSGPLLIDAQWRRGVAERKALIGSGALPDTHNAPGDIHRVGEVLVIEGDSQTVGQDMSGRYGIEVTQLQQIARKVIAFAGDVFDGITVWMTFRDGSNDALAYAFNVRNDVAGLGPSLPVLDRSGNFGSARNLKVIANMMAIGLNAGDAQEGWRDELETWGQETGHRWMAFMRARYRGANSDILLGRDCAHYHAYVDTQASVHDGRAWRDNRDGTFTFLEATRRFGDLDLYGMGLMPGDEMPPFFVIDDIPNYVKSECNNYRMPRLVQSVTGVRYDITIDDIVAANGPRVPAWDTGYVREAQVVITQPGESGMSNTAIALAQRVDRARIWWEQWALAATRNRMVVCTRSSGDCGDPRSDVVGISVNPGTATPNSAPIPIDVGIANTGARTATGIKTWARVEAGGMTFKSGDPVAVPDLAAGQQHGQRFMFDLGTIPCGTEATVTAWTQSDFHYHRGIIRSPLGVEDKVREDFEQDRGWTVNPDGNDTGQDATWERGHPRETFILATRVQPNAAHSGENAWVTGLIPTAGTTGGFVRGGLVTLQSPLIPAAGLRDPTLRYWVSFAGVRADTKGTGIEASPDSYLSVSVRTVSSSPDPDAAAGSGWVELERLTTLITDGWQERSVALPRDLDVSGGLQFRFVAADANPKSGGVEAAIDDVVVTSNLAACYAPVTVAGDGGAGDGGSADPGGEGCGCRVGGPAGHPASVGWAFGFTIALTWLGPRLRRRRRRRPG